MKRTLLLLSLLSLVLSYGCSSNKDQDRSTEIQQEESSSMDNGAGTGYETDDQMMEDQSMEDQRMEDQGTSPEEKKVEESESEDAMDS